MFDPNLASQEESDYNAERLELEGMKREDLAYEDSWEVVRKLRAEYNRNMTAQETQANRRSRVREAILQASNGNPVRVGQVVIR